MFKSGFVTILGRPNVGKSTLINQFIGEKLSIVSSKPQTTRNNIQAILNKKDCQIIFVDTPGLHKPRHKLGEYMVKVAQDAVRDVDIVLFITTPSDEIGKGDLAILEQLKEVKKPVFFVLNKIDENTQERVAENIKMYSSAFDFTEFIPISALKGNNVDMLLELMTKYLPEGPKYYPDDMITDQKERFVVSEIIREKALRLLSDEVPHGVAIEIISMKEDDSHKVNIEADLLCEKESHKGIIIGREGSMLKKITEYSRKDIETFLSKKVKLKLWVKVKKNWRDNNFTLKELGYKL